MLFRIAGSLWLFLLAIAVPAIAEPLTPIVYTVEGSDAFRTGNAPQTQITYSGLQRLTLVRSGKATVYTASVDYRRNDGNASTHDAGTFVSRVMPDGEQIDEVTRDPDYLTVLNQPFAVRLDAATLRDLRGLRRSVPFDFPSPMTGAPLHGVLRRLADGDLRGERVLGIAFSATGPLHGALPDRPGLVLAGAISMNGTAYYAYASALLLALDATLAIEGKLDESSAHQPVTIVYRRTIRPAPAP